MDHKSKSIVAQTILGRLGIHPLVKTEANGTVINVISDVARLSFTQDGKVLLAINMAADQMVIAILASQMGGAFNHTMQITPPFLTTWDINTGDQITVSRSTHPDTFEQFLREHVQQLAVMSIQKEKVANG